MNKKLALLATPVVMLAASTAIADHKLWDLNNVRPYIGVDAQWRHMNFDAGRGNNLFRHNSPQGNVYAGIQLNDYIGLEAGYETTTRKTRTTQVGPGDTIAGNTIPNPGPTFRYDSTMFMHGPHINVTAFAPLCDQYRLELIGLVGMARLKGRFVRSQVFNTALGGVVNPPAQVVFSRTRSVLRLGAGVQHMMTDNWGLRVMVNFENTSRMNTSPTQTSVALPSGSSINTKNSMIYSLGAVFKF